MEVFEGDVCRRETLGAFFAPSAAEQVVIHCAGIVSISSGYQQRVYDVNVGGTKNIVDECVERVVGKLVYVSSVHALPERPACQTITEEREFDPDAVEGLYARTKAEATAYVLTAARGRGLNASVVHPSGIIGPYDRGGGHMTALIADYCNRRLTAAVNGGYDLVDVRDVARGIIACCERGRSGECYILSNRYFGMRELLEALHELTGRPRIRVYLPLWLVRGAAPLCEAYYRLRRRPPLFTRYSLRVLASNGAFCHNKARTELGYAPTDMRRTLADTVEWLERQGRVKPPRARARRLRAACAR